MTVITFARQVGSGGHAIATALSERCGLRVIGRRELRDEATKQGLSLPESFVRFASEESELGSLNHYLSYGELEFDLALRGGSQTAGDVYDPGFLEEITANSREILLTLQILIYEFAAKGHVLFVGAGAQILLAGIPNVLKVKIIAPAETRIERMKNAYGLSEEEAQAAVHGGDREQIDYNRVIFGEDWNNTELWDIVVNSETLSVEQIVDLIASQAASASLASAHKRTLIHASAVSRALLDNPALGNVYAFAVPTSTGILVRGDVPNEDIRRVVIDLVRSLSETTPVSNGLSVPLFR